MIKLQDINNFTEAGQQILKFLYTRFGFKLWMITRTEGNDWIVLQSEDHGYNVSAGDVFKWTDSFCSQMVQGNGPCIAPKSNKIPAYFDAPIGQQVPIKAYIGFPLYDQGGGLFGTLCAIDPEPQSNFLIEEQPLIELLSQLLSRLLQMELDLLDDQRAIEKLQEEVHKDALTHIYNRRGWDALLAAEETRCQLYGHKASIFVIDLDNLKQTNDQKGHLAGDTLIIKAVTAMQSALAPSDILARLGGDEFAILGVERDVNDTRELYEQLLQAFDDANIQASIGFSSRQYNKTLDDALRLADKLMYEQKKQHKLNAQNTR